MSALTLREVAAELRISTSTVRKLIAVDGLPCIRLGSRVIIRRQDLDRWIEGGQAAASFRRAIFRPEHVRIAEKPPVHGSPGV